MSDSIDLLEAVGRDASLRRLPPDELAQRLKAAGASAVLASAAEQRDGSVLCAEFGSRVLVGPNHGNDSFHDNPDELEIPAPGGVEDDEEADDVPKSASAGPRAH
jgi:hypothetical protein